MPNISDFGSRDVAATVTIASGQSLSGYIDLFGCDLVAIYMPSAWTAAPLTFQVSPYDPADSRFTQWNELYKSTGENDGAEYIVSSTAAAAVQVVTLPEDDFCGFRFLKVRSGTSASPVNQAASRSLILICRPVS